MNNVPPTVMAIGDTIDEGGIATVSAEFTRSGHARYAHGDHRSGATAPGAAGVARAAHDRGVDHVYGDNGEYAVTVTITDDDGGAGMAARDRDVNNLDPIVTLDLSGAVSFPGGNYFVVHAGGTLRPRPTRPTPAPTI